MHDVTLGAAPGAVSVVLGANGADKTTLMDGIAGLAPLRSSTIKLAGTPIEKLAPYKRSRAGPGYVEHSRTCWHPLGVRRSVPRRDLNALQGAAADCVEGR